MEKNDVKCAQKNIMAWYRSCGRHDLPWRKTMDIYHIAVSEIMLQQTNVPKVIEKYISFIERFPTIESLAKSQQKDVIMQWQGLGYNRRAIYLHKMAQSVQNDFGGFFPEDPNILISLIGFGPYTSRSIPIFARNCDIAACDVNIARIMRRVHKVNDASEKQVIFWTEELLYHGHSRDWHNALMDFASIICTKRSPQCEMCPIKKQCLSFPDPQDAKKILRTEVGRSEHGKHIPRRIFRGRIIEYLRTHKGTTDQIGNVIKKDWQSTKDRVWCESVLKGLKKDHMIVCEDGVWLLK